MSNNGCDSIILITTLSQNWINLFVPNSFSPNDDGINDTFYAYSDFILDFKMNIFNCWGEVIFKSENIKHGWNGTDNGLPVQEGIYVWMVDFTDEKTNENQRRGTVALMK